MAYLNEFFGLVVPILTAHGGHANKLLGDGLLGRLRRPRAAARPRRPRPRGGRRHAAPRSSRSFGERCRIGIGINSGLVLVGTIGGGGVAEFGVIGDPVNVAARVQDATRDLGEPLLLTEATRCLLERTGRRPRGARIAAPEGQARRRSRSTACRIP